MPSVFWEPAGVVPQRPGRHNQQTIRAFLNTREPELIGVGLCLRFVSVFALVRYCLNGVLCVQYKGTSAYISDRPQLYGMDVPAAECSARSVYPTPFTSEQIGLDALDVLFRN